MLKNWKKRAREWKYYLLAILTATIGKGLLRLLLSTCQWKIEGLERFKSAASKDKCLLMLWHNRLAIAPFILYKFAPDFIYAAVVSHSQDGRLIQAVVRSYKAGRTISVPHNARYQALRELVRYVKEKQEIVIMTPDGPKGPCYQVKPGLAVAALETGAQVFPLTWSANRYWEMKTWDKLKIPKPFSTISVSFKKSVCFSKEEKITIQEAQDILRRSLPTR